MTLRSTRICGAVLKLGLSLAGPINRRTKHCVRVVPVDAVAVTGLPVRKAKTSVRSLRDPPDPDDRAIAEESLVDSIPTDTDLTDKAANFGDSFTASGGRLAHF